MKLFNKISMLLWGVVENATSNDIIVGLKYFDKHPYLQEINCSCI